MITDIDIPGVAPERARPSRTAPGPAPGGDVLFCTRYIDHILYFLLQQLARDVPLRILCSQANEWTQQLARDGARITLRRPRSRFDRRFKAEIGRMHAERPLHLAHCVHGNAELANVIRWAGSRVPVIAYRAYIGHLKFRENPSAYWNARHPRLAAVVAVSRAVKTYLESFRFLCPRNVHAINHGVNGAWIAARAAPDPALRSRLGIGPQALVVASMANLRPYKRFDLVVEAAQRLAHRPVHFVHIGEDRGWKERAPKLPNLHFLGRLSEPWPIIAAADVFASTAHEEAFGRSNLEAMACGKPLIGSSTGGLLDLVEHGVNGRLFESGNAGSFADQVLLYEQDRAAVERHAAKARELVSTRLSSEGMARRYLDLYTSVLRERTSAA